MHTNFKDSSKKQTKEEVNILDKINNAISTNKSSKDEPCNNTVINQDALDSKEPIGNGSINLQTDTKEYTSIHKSEEKNFIAFEFRGTAREYFKIWIVNIALTLLTLGVYSAWAKVRSLRYIYGNTYINNSNFEFNAEGKKIFLGRIVIISFYILFLLFSDYLVMYKIAAGILVIFLLILPWLIRQAISFKLKSASYRNIPFKLHAKARSFYFLIVIAIVSIVALSALIVAADKFSGHEMAALVGLSFYLLLFLVIMPLLYRRYKLLVIKNSSYANEFFNFTATKKDTIYVFVKMFFLSIGIFFIIASVSILAAGIINSTLEYLQYHKIEISRANLYLKYIVMFSFVLLYLFISGLYKGINDGYLSNFTRDYTEIKDAKFKGEINPMTLGFISATNSIFLLFSLGLLYPWTKLRYLKYKIENTYLAYSDYDKFVSSGYEKFNPIGEETLDFFDIDIGV